jgi:hypothetical protein
MSYFIHVLSEAIIFSILSVATLTLIYFRGGYYCVLQGPSLLHLNHLTSEGLEKYCTTPVFWGPVLSRGLKSSPRLVQDALSKINIYARGDQAPR